MKAEINNKRWKGVPIYFMTGKKLDQKSSEIIIQFEDDENLNRFWPNAAKNNSRLVIKVAPQEGVHFQFNVKEPGLGQKLVPAVLDYCHSCLSMGNTPEAYEKLLLDLINKNRTLFARWDEIESSWEIVEKLKSKLMEPLIYESFSDIEEFIKKSGIGDLNDL
jgi:glucose-6-phosphate 1-dehydrogenase